MNWINIAENIFTLSFDDVSIFYGTNSLADQSSISGFLTPNELSFSAKLKDSENKKTWIACRATLRQLLGDYLKVSPLEISFKKGKYGKPYLTESSLNFNVSHTRTSFLLGFNKFGRIGVDIEKLFGREEIQEIISLMFSNNEVEYCSSIAGNKGFLDIWTLKEAFLKASGIGLIDNLKYISVIDAANNNIINRFNLKSKTFTSPNGETGAVVYAKYY